MSSDAENLPFLLQLHRRRVAGSVTMEVDFKIDATATLFDYRQNGIAIWASTEYDIIELSNSVAKFSHHRAQIQTTALFLQNIQGDIIMSPPRGRVAQWSGYAWK